MSFIKLVSIVFFFTAISCSNHSKSKQEAESNYYTQATTNRTAAEWEPATETMIVWPLSVPYKLVIELAKDNHLYTLVANDSAKKDWLKKTVTCFGE